MFGKPFEVKILCRKRKDQAGYSSLSFEVKKWYIQEFVGYYIASFLIMFEKPFEVEILYCKRKDQAGY